jgi:GT2 family glycosyltransferase
MLSSVSVLVISRDRRELLHSVLGDLRQQDFAGEYEIVVVEETDDPQAPDGVVYVPHPMKNLGIAYARNMSVKHAKHDILVFIDDDCRVQTDWLSLLVAPLEDEQVLGVQGGVVVPEGTNALGWAESLLGFPGGGVTRVIQAHGKAEETKEISTLNAAYRKRVLIQVGGFPSEARYGGEDYVLAKRVAEKGKLMFEPHAMVYHEARADLRKVWPWFVRRGQAEVEMVRAGGVDLSPAAYGWHVLRTSVAVKLFVFVFLLLLSWQIAITYLLVWFGFMLWRFRWVLQNKSVPNHTLLVLPALKLTMDMALDVGRFKVWWK